MKKITLLIIFIFSILSLITFRRTNSLLNDTEKKTNNILSIATDFGSSLPSPSGTSSPINPSPIFSPLPSTLNHLVINEVYYRPDSNHTLGNENQSEWIELFNPTPNDISLNGWSIKDNTSCEDLNASLILPSGNFALIIATNSASFQTKWVSNKPETIFIQLTPPIGNGLANNDELILRNTPCSDNSSDKVDHISWGTNTNGLNPALPLVNEGHSLEREPDGYDTDTASDFVDRNQPTPGN